MSLPLFKDIDSAIKELSKKFDTLLAAFQHLEAVVSSDTPPCSPDENIIPPPTIDLDDFEEPPTKKSKNGMETEVQLPQRKLSKAIVSTAIKPYVPKKCL